MYWYINSEQGISVTFIKIKKFNGKHYLYRYINKDFYNIVLPSGSTIWKDIYFIFV